MNVTKLNALRRLTMKVHSERPAPRKSKQWSIQLYDGELWGTAADTPDAPAHWQLMPPASSNDSEPAP